MRKGSTLKSKQTPRDITEGTGRVSRKSGRYVQVFTDTQAAEGMFLTQGGAIEATARRWESSWRSCVRTMSGREGRAAWARRRAADSARFLRMLNRAKSSTGLSRSIGHSASLYESSTKTAPELVAHLGIRSGSTRR